MKRLMLFIFAFIFTISLASSLDWYTNSTAYFRFENNTGQAQNLLNTSTNITLYGSPKTVTGLINNSINLTFSPNNDSGIMNNYLFPNYQKSISVWVKPTGANTQMIIDGGSASVGLAAWGLGWNYVGSDNKFWIHGQGGDSVANITSSAGTWHHVVITQAFSGTRKIYVNGVWVGNSTAAYNIGSGIVRLGKFTDGTGQFNGDIDELWIVQRELNQSDVTELYNSGSGLAHPIVYNPEIVLNTPINNSEFINNQNVNFSCSIINSININNISLVLNGIVNSTVSGETYNNNLRVTGAHNSTLNYTCVARNSSNYQFTGPTYTNRILHYKVNNVTYTPSVTIFTSTPIELNLSYDSNLYTATVNLVYNGTSYSSSRTGTSENFIFSRTQQLNTVGNFTFYWDINLVNSTWDVRVNSSLYSQNVSTINLDDCTSYSNLLINYTMYDEGTKVRLNPTSTNTSLELLLQLGDSSLTNYITFAMNKSRVNSIHVCSQNNLANSSLRLDQTVKYTSLDRATEYYVTQNETINSTYLPFRVDLFLLNSTDATRFVITYKDNSYIATPGVVIEIRRQYISENNFTVVEAPETDQQGKTIGNFVLNNIVYNIYVKKDNQVVAIFEGIRVYCATSECSLNLNQPSSTSLIEDLIRQYGITFSKSYSTLTRTYSLSFNSIDGNAKLINLTGRLYNNAMNLTLCSNAVTSLSNSLDCVIPAQYSNVTVLFTSTVNGYQLTNELIQITNRGVNDSVKYILAFFVILTLVGLGASTGKGALTMIFGMLGFIFVGTLYLVDYRGFIGVASAITWLIIAAAIIIVKIVGGKHDE